ncbi:Creatinase/aminopeptidase [Crucibulum laeve]|uniref:Creatinase/aminopeptidase n=1 Tax=Crucibulum laeve TaxID=68775 RepID=A0A5C3MBC9_9AGAR|nr:Creatinase/aminopeptidase [Crucibulum laeve]
MDSKYTASPIYFPSERRRRCNSLWVVLFSFVVLVIYYGCSGSLVHLSQVSTHCSNVPPIDSVEYLARQTSLAKALQSAGALAYIAEPGANTQYFAGFSNTHWRLSERPLLLVISLNSNGESQVSIVTPKFEATRAKSLPVYSNSTVSYIEWPEEVNPYTATLSHLGITEGIVFIDSAVRKFIADGLEQASNSEILSAPAEIKEIRERKSKAEIDILKCANEATLLAIRQVHKKLHIGIRESQARSLMSEALQTMGLRDGGCLTLFGENAALPHGSGTDRSLQASDFALFDCTASLHGYYSDVTRTVALHESHIPSDHLQIWRSVHKAQHAASLAAKAGAITADVDAAARSSLKKDELDPYFTHRLGHGIGIEVHEQPYLLGGTNDTIKTGHTFSNEPGVYIEGKVGVRLEDCFYIDEDGKYSFFTQGVGGPSEAPTFP